MLSLEELERAARVLDERIRGHRLQAVVQSEGERLTLTTYGPSPEGGSHRQHVLLSGRPGSARVSLVARPPAALPTPPAVAQYLRAHALGARIASVGVREGDRLLSLRLETKRGPLELLLAILGPRSNLYLLDAQQRVVAALRPHDATRPELAAGATWHPPASRPPHRGEDRFASESDADLLEAIESHYAEAEEEGAHAAQLRRLEQAFRREAKTRVRRRERLERELAEARDATGLERQGELLKSVLSRVERGDREVVARDFETGEEVTIPLDPTKSPAENLALCFKRYRKAVRTLTKAGAQEEQARVDAEEIDALAAELRAIGERGEAGREALERFAARPAVARLLARHAPKPPPRPQREGGRERRGPPARLRPRRYRSSDGLEIWVGRSDEGNDHLTTRLARGNDLFFHLDGAPGSHVVLRTEGRADPPSESLLEACELAVHFSKQRRAGSADVHVVPIKNVRKPRGAKPGLVMVHGGRSVHLRRIPQRLQRILDA